MSIEEVEQTGYDPLRRRITPLVYGPNQYRLISGENRSIRVVLDQVADSIFAGTAFAQFMRTHSSFAVGNNDQGDEEFLYGWHVFVDDQERERRIYTTHEIQTVNVSLVVAEDGNSRIVDDANASSKFLLQSASQDRYGSVALLDEASARVIEAMMIADEEDKYLRAGGSQN